MLRIYFIFILLATFAIGCGIDLDPCTYEVGETLELVAQETGFSSTIRLNRSGCDSLATLKIENGPILQLAGQTVKVKVTHVNNEDSYIVEVIDID